MAKATTVKRAISKKVSKAASGPIKPVKQT